MIGQILQKIVTGIKKFFQALGRGIAKIFRAIGQAFKRLGAKISQKSQERRNKNQTKTTVSSLESQENAQDQMPEASALERREDLARGMQNAPDTYGAEEPNSEDQAISPNSDYYSEQARSAWSTNNRYNSQSETITPKTYAFPYKSPDLASQNNQATMSERNHYHSETIAESVQPSTTNTYQVVEPSRAEACAPKTLEEFLDVVKRTPKTVLSGRQRNLLASVMSFATVTVGEIMLPKEAITYVHDDEILGPLMLDRLYKSGFSHFPVVDHTNEVVGIIHTAVLNSLEEKETHRAGEFMERRACFVREDYTLNQALAAFFRTNSYFFIVIDRYGKTVGLLTYQMLTNFLFGKRINDDFSSDSNRMLVAKRELPAR